MVIRKHRSQKRRGAAAVETAFVLSAFMLFVVGIMEYGRFLFVMNLATNATATAARYAVVHTGDGTSASDVQTTCTDAMSGQTGAIAGYTVAVFAAQPGVSPPTAIAGVNWYDTAFGNGICVRITGTYSFAGANLLGISPISVNVSAVMTSEAN